MLGLKGIQNHEAKIINLARELLASVPSMAK